MTEHISQILDKASARGAVVVTMLHDPGKALEEINAISSESAQDLLDHLLSLPELQETREHSHPTRNYCNECWAQDIRNKAIRDVRAALKRELGTEVND